MTCVLAGHLQESRGPPGRKPRKSLKKVFLGVPAQSLKKVPKRSKSPRKVSKKCLFGDFSTFSGLFSDSGPEGPGRLFWDFFAVFGPEGLETPVDGRQGRNRWLQKKHQWEPLCLHLPPKDPHSEHGLSIPSPETEIMVWVSPFPGTYGVWGGLSFARTIHSSRKLLGVKSLCLNCETKTFLLGQF